MLTSEFASLSTADEQRIRDLLSRRFPAPGDHELARQGLSQLLAIVSRLRHERSALRSIPGLLMHDVDGVTHYRTARGAPPALVPADVRAAVRRALGSVRRHSGQSSANAGRSSIEARR